MFSLPSSECQTKILPIAGVEREAGRPQERQQNTPSGEVGLAKSRPELPCTCDIDGSSDDLEQGNHKGEPLGVGLL